MYTERCCRTKILEAFLFVLRLSGFHRLPVSVPLTHSKSHESITSIEDLRNSGLSSTGVAARDSSWLSITVCRVYMDDRSFFYFPLVKTSHNEFNYADYTDAEFPRSFTNLKVLGRAKQGGGRFSQWSQFEIGGCLQQLLHLWEFDDSRPARFSVYPRWFIDDVHLRMAENIKRNRRRLTAHCDVRAAFLTFPNLSRPRTSCGLSFLGDNEEDVRHICRYNRHLFCRLFRSRQKKTLCWLW